MQSIIGFHISLICLQLPLMNHAQLVLDNETVIQVVICIKGDSDWQENSKGAEELCNNHTKTLNAQA